jgi:hypothetical protein
MYFLNYTFEEKKYNLCILEKNLNFVLVFFLKNFV